MTPLNVASLDDIAEAGSPLLVLIGPPAAGKSRIGKRVARRLGVPFIDTDRLVAAEHGAIPTIFAERGEQVFRELEASAVLGALGRHAVVSLGGGAVMTPAVAEALDGHPVVLLTVTEAAATERLDPETRPLVRDGIGAWVALVQKRMPTYRALAVAEWDTSTRPIEGIADEIAQWVSAHATPGGES